MFTQASKKWFLVAFSLVTGILLSVGMMTIISAQGDVITACVNNQNGNTRIVSSSADCRNSEHSIQWNTQGEAGPQGPAGLVGPIGPQGPAGVSGYQIVEVDHVVGAGGFLRETTLCPAGKVVLGGGAQVVGEGTADFDTTLQESGPATVGGGAQSGWLVAIQNNSIVTHTIGIFAVCANAS